MWPKYFIHPLMAVCFVNVSLDLHSFVRLFVFTTQSCHQTVTIVYRRDGNLFDIFEPKKSWILEKERFTEIRKMCRLTFFCWWFFSFIWLDDWKETKNEKRKKLIYLPTYSDQDWFSICKFRYLVWSIRINELNWIGWKYQFSHLGDCFCFG